MTAANSEDAAYAFYERFTAPLRKDQVPIVYHDAVNISFWGIENLHSFDTKKYRRIRNALVHEHKLLKESQFPTTKSIPTRDDLLLIHSEDYLRFISSSSGVAHVCEFPPIAIFPYFLTESKVVIPMKVAMAGTIIATHFAVQRGWSFNLGGGFHHSTPTSAGGWCMFGDIPYSWLLAQMAYPDLKKMMYIDLDAHQGNGFERFWMNDPNIYILDAYNRKNYPMDHHAKKAIKQMIELEPGTKDDVYLARLKFALKTAFDEFSPDIIYYNAGTDILEEDALGGLSVSIDGVVQRDEIVFEYAFTRDIPIVMVPSGGYSSNSAVSIVKSLLNLRQKFGLF